MGRTLTPDLQAAYRRDGFVLIEDAVPPDTLRALRTVTERLIEASRDVVENDAVHDRYLRSDALLDLVRPLLGPDIRLHNSKLNTKAAQGGAPVHSA